MPELLGRCETGLSTARESAYEREGLFSFIHLCNVGYDRSVKNMD